MKQVKLHPELLVEKLDHNALLAAALATIVIPITHMLLHRYLIVPLGHRWCGVLPGNEGARYAARQNKLMKFQQSCWKFCVYTVLVTASFYALSKETFWWNGAEFFSGCKQRLPCAYQASSEMKFAYSLEAGYITYAIPYATFVDIRRKDYWATMLHHVVTLLLITCSYAMGFNKIGLVLMFIHDVADPFLELAKMGNYAHPPRQKLTNRFFIVFALLWIILRDIYFPLWVIYGVLFHAVDGIAGDADPTPYMWVYYGFSGLLIILLLLHLFWTRTILKIAFSVSEGGSAKDSREEDDEDEDKRTR